MLVLYPIFYNFNIKFFINFLKVSLTLVCIFLAIVVYDEFNTVIDIYKLLEMRILTINYFESPRLQLVLAGIEIWSNHPLFGVGLNNSQVMLENYKITDITGPNLHSNWLQIFVEKGIFAFSTIIYFMFIFYSSLRYGNRYGSSLALCIIVLAIVGFFNNAIAHSFIQVLLVAQYCVIIQERRR
jgi:O-antigen ligase